jgi:hypothetical protein
MELKLAVETEVPGENMPQSHFVLGRRSEESMTNRLSYGTE